MEKKQILLVNDMVGYGKVSMSAMFPILSYMGHGVSSMPTALVSNTFNYGRYAIQDTTDYMRGVIETWGQLGFAFDAVCTGFLCSDEQAGIVADFCVRQAQAGAAIFVDPVMGDDGELYTGISADRVEWMRRIVGVADLSFPNVTEACLLTGTEWRAEGFSRAEALQLVDRMVAIGSKSVLITSAKVDGQSSVVGFNAADGQHFVLPYVEVPAFFHGTGDVFSAIVMGHVLNGDTLQVAADAAMQSLTRLIESNKDLPDKFKGLPIESCMDLIS